MLWWILISIWVISVIGIWYVLFFYIEPEVGLRDIDLRDIPYILGKSLLISPIAPIFFIGSIFAARAINAEYAAKAEQREQYILQDFYADEIFPEFYKEQIYLSWFLSFSRRKECFEKALKECESDPKASVILEEAYAYVSDAEEFAKESRESLKKATGLWKQVAEIRDLEEPFKISR